MALTVTFIPETMTTNALWAVCNLKEREIHGHLLTDSALLLASCVISMEKSLSNDAAYHICRI